MHFCHTKITFVHEIRCRWVSVAMVAMHYKATMLPLLDYADLVYEQNIKYVNK